MNFSAVEYYQGDGRYPQRSVTQQNISKLTFLPDDNILDVGCGTGEETKSIAKKVRRITGIDTSVEMLDFARQYNYGPNITYIKWDAQTCGDNPDWLESFDKVVCLFVLHWFTDHAKALRSILSCLKPGGEGLFLITRTSLYSEAAIFLAHHPKWADYVKGYTNEFRSWGLTIDETEDVFVSSGWTDVQCEVQAPLTFSELQAKSCLKTLLGQTALIPEGEQGVYLADLWQWALSKYEDENQIGNIRFDAETIVVHACKPSQN